MGGTLEAPKPEQIISDLRRENESLRRALLALVGAKRNSKAWREAVKNATEALIPFRSKVKEAFQSWEQPTTSEIDWAFLKKAFGKTQKKLPPQYGGDGLYYLMDGSKKVNQAQMNRDDARQRNADRAKHEIKPRWWWSGKK